MVLGGASYKTWSISVGGTIYYSIGASGSGGTGASNGGNGGDGGASIYATGSNTGGDGGSGSDSALLIKISQILRLTFWLKINGIIILYFSWLYLS